MEIANQGLAHWLECGVILIGPNGVSYFSISYSRVSTDKSNMCYILSSLDISYCKLPFLILPVVFKELVGCKMYYYIKIHPLIKGLNTMDVVS